MDRTEFKKRMQSLKSYRENNPGKGYWDWKVEAFDGGGETMIVSPTTGLTINPNTFDFLSKIFLKEHRDERTSAAMYRTAHAAQGAVGTAIDTGPINIADATIQNTTDDPGEVYFLSLQNQRKAMRDRGYQVINTDIETDPYGLVRGAVKRLQNNGRKVPVYQINDYSDPNVSREDLIMVPPLKDQNEDFKYARFAKLRHAGSHPIRYYIHKDTGEVYIRGWDLNDYGGSSAGSGGAYNAYGKIGRWAANKLDEMGTPFVQRSGFVPLKSSLEELNKLRKTYYDQIDKLKDDPSYKIPSEISRYPFIYGSIWDFNESESKKNIEKYRKELGFSNGGEVPPSDYQGSNEPARVNPITGKLLANGAVTPVLNLEGAANFTPVGDVLSIRDMYVAARNRDLLGLGLAGLGILPFMSRIRPIDRPPIPTVNKDAIQRQIDLSVSQTDKNKKVLDDFYDQRNRVYESLIENEDAFRRAARADRRSGTSYMQTYQDMVREYGRDNSNLNPNLAQPGYDRSLYEQPVKAQVSTSNPDLIRLNPRYKDPEELDETFQSLNPGLIRHEMGHSADIKSGLDYTKSLADPSKFESESRIKEMYPKSYKNIQDYLLNGSEIKSHMNEFRDFLFNKGEYQPKETINSIRKKLDKYGSQFKNLNILFDLYKNKRQFVNDYNLIPITATENNDNLV